MNETLLTRARHNYKVAKSLKSIMGNDELYLNNIGYNLQQSVELAVKFIIEQNGIEYPATHDLSQLYRIAKKNNIDLLMTEYIYEHLEMFTSWEAKTRYILNFVLEEDKVLKAIEEVHLYLLVIEKKYDPVIYSINVM